MPNLAPLVTSRADNQNLFAPANQDVVGAQADIAYNNSWTQLLTSPPVLSTIILVPGLQPNTPLSCTIQCKTRGQQNITDTANCWLMSAYASTGQIYIYLYGGGGGTNGAPVDNANFGVSWAVVGDPTP